MTPAVAAPVPAAESLNLLNVDSPPGGRGTNHKQGGLFGSSCGLITVTQLLFEYEPFRVSIPETG